jgi:transcriptional regulator with XRE-family HTH domain
MRLPRTKEWREARGFSQRELSAEAGLGESTVPRVERGDSVTPPTARKIAEALNVSVSDLLEAPPVPLASAPPASPSPDAEAAEAGQPEAKPVLAPPPFRADDFDGLLEGLETYLDDPTGPERRPGIVRACSYLSSAIGREIVVAFAASGLAEKWDRGTATDADIAPWLRANEERGKVQDRLRRIAGKAYAGYKSSERADLAIVHDLDEHRRRARSEAERSNAMLQGLAS